MTVLSSMVMGISAILLWARPDLYWLTVVIRLGWMAIYFSTLTISQICLYLIIRSFLNCTKEAGASHSHKYIPKSLCTEQNKTQTFLLLFVFKFYLYRSLLTQHLWLNGPEHLLLLWEEAPIVAKEPVERPTLSWLQDCATFPFIHLF